MINGDYILVRASDNYPGKKYRGKYCYEHVLVFWKNYGIIPKSDEVIHHKDGNKHNNDISNLELKSRKQHSSDHGSKKKITYVKLRCPFCDKEFIKEKRKTYLIKGGKYSCCSKECLWNFLKLDKETQNIKIKNNYIEEIIM